MSEPHTSAAAGMKTCTRCGRSQPREQFYVQRARKDGLTIYCKTCWREKRAARRGARNATQKQWTVRNKGYRAEYRRLKEYGLTPEAYERLLARSGGGCAACGGPGGKLGLHVDHCHETGHVRGLLCHACNTSIGLLKEDPERLRALIDYINATKQIPSLF